MSGYINTVWFAGTISLLYVALLFVVAIWGNRVSRSGWQPYIYSLTLAIFCTTWAFYGTVQQAAYFGWWLAPTYLGAILLITLGWKLFDRIVRIARQENSTTISDFISARYGHSRGIGMTVALLCLLGVVPYIALQLKAVSGSFQLLTSSAVTTVSWFRDPTLYIAAFMALFSILFGTRTVDSSESHRGMMLAIAFESLIKLVAMLAVGCFAVYGLYDGFADLWQRVMQQPDLAQRLADYHNPSIYLTHVLLGGLAIVALPRHFHVAVVEYRSERDIQTARWLFPLYLLLMNLFVLPLALVAALQPGILELGYITLTIPLLAGQDWLALLAYLGGFSAGTSMVIISSITLATMMCNELLLPGLIKLGWQGPTSDIRQRVLVIRRLTILVILILGFVYYRMLSRYHSLAEIGFLSFVAVAQFAPAMLIGLIWHGANRSGAAWGIGTGFVVWLYCLFLPVLAGEGWLPAVFLNGHDWLPFLRPHALFGLEGLDPGVHGTFWSLLLNCLALVLGSLYYKPGFADVEQAQRFVMSPEPGMLRSGRQAGVRVDDLRALLLRFLSAAKVASLFEATSNPLTGRLLARGQVDDVTLRAADRLLRSVVGRRGADLLLRNLLDDQGNRFSNLNNIMDEVSEVVLFNRDVLNAVLHSLNQGITVIDENDNLVAWNQKFAALYQFPPGYLYVGQSSENVVRFIARSGGYGDGDEEDMVRLRREEVRNREALLYVRETSDGRHIQLNGIPINNSLYVTVYTDITDQRHIERRLRLANEVLEERVSERTRELRTLNEDLEKANRNKTRFLAAAGHDLVQPLNSATLFSASIISKLERRREQAPELVDAVLPVACHLDQSLHAAESLLGELLEISKLDADIIRARYQVLPLGQILESLLAEFRPLIERKGLVLRTVPTSLTVRTDPVLLRRILQNLLANALRYTSHGRILVGGRRRGTHVEVQVLDSGPGIPDSELEAIFEEFHRLPAAGPDVSSKGLGLGLSIVQRLGQLLDHPVRVQSVAGRGSCFGVLLPSVEAELPIERIHPPLRANGGSGLILCVDNEIQITTGMSHLLGDWGYEVRVAADENGARAILNGARPALVIVDYHLDEGRTGLQLLASLQQEWSTGQDVVAVPGLVISADYTDEVKQAIEQQGYRLLRKPVKPMALRAVINRLLETL
ncbi:hybrid sensor histidine kinase/response regulator [Parathalassolituus penaei]|uniref:histidine kinase n=1 Tax=Parathalassolituus penaei TaxID=2997323 RepID=A0A9X3EIN8_9GAMM|nr:PAS domain-containing hybrid sensor histidine kinase/response regulator [Parathalassolituus penaei]MCY0967444.1 PAS domain-containing hybrid sensor histidine kinase/response regulator [Parathalassolituus penaei]